MEKDKILAIIRAYVSKMPPLPITVAKVLEITNSPKTSPADLNQIISLDPVLMGKVMRLINSAYYSLPNQITSLVRAIIMLGINTVKNLALSTAILGNLGKASDFQALNMEGFWRHSISVGVTAKLMATRRNVDPKLREEYFIAGLLHDIGKIPLNNKLADEYVQAISHTDREHVPLYQSEEQILLVNHAVVGTLIIDNWRLGENLADAVAFHHSVEEYTGTHRDLVLTVAIANLFSNTFELGFSGDRYPAPVPEEHLREVGVDWDYLESIEDTVKAEIEKAQIFLKVAG
jgi:putative nucleotidyltransferase with HDIG domain